MSNADSQIDSRRIRVLNGPLRGAAFVLSRRVTLGRSCDADVQLIDGGVSRQHAQVVESLDGRHVLVDLDSTNGTFVDGRRVRRHVLKLGTVFKIMRSKLIYEATPQVVAEEEEPSGLVMRRPDGRTLRATIEYGVADLPSPMGPRRDVDAPRPRDATSDTNTVAAVSRGDERHWISAALPDGSPYPGDVLEDIVAYRSLRTRILRGEYVDEPETRRLRALERRLRSQPSEDGARQYHRWECRVPANLRLVAGSAQSVTVADIAVDGARVIAPDHEIARNTLVWLAIGMVARGGRPQTLVFPGRVAWVDRGGLGLSFSGTPGWSRRGGRESSERTVVAIEPAAPRQRLESMSLMELRIESRQQQTEG